MAKSLENSTIRTVRELYIILALVSGPQNAAEIRDEYAMTAKEVMEESSIYRVLNKLMKAKLIRYASTHKGEVHPSELSGDKRYALTDSGKAFYTHIRRIVESADGSRGRISASEGEDDLPGPISDRQD